MWAEQLFNAHADIQNWITKQVPESISQKRNSLGHAAHLGGTCNSSLFSAFDILSGHFPEVPWWVCTKVPKSRFFSLWSDLLQNF